jgi:hypothetical protein
LIRKGGRKANRKKETKEEKTARETKRSQSLVAAVKGELARYLKKSVTERFRDLERDPA